MKRALKTLSGLSVGDAFGEAKSYQYYEVRDHADTTNLPADIYRYTDDTAMAIAIIETLELRHSVEADFLAWKFGQEFHDDPDRGYGRMARKLLREYFTGREWRELSPQAFGGGSFGNGAAMRVAPLGAYFADSPQELVGQAEISAQVTHFHAEGVAGAISIAMATAAIWQNQMVDIEVVQQKVWEAAVSYIEPETSVARKITKARSMPFTESPEKVAREVGNGAEISAQDTVPFCLWNAIRCLGDYREAILSTIEVGGDCDTNAAIVGGLVTSFSPVDDIPEEWSRTCEKPNVKRH